MFEDKHKTPILLLFVFLAGSIVGFANAVITAVGGVLIMGSMLYFEKRNE